jgi:hypothetical protein
MRKHLLTMNNLRTYHILIEGQVAQEEINATSPLQMTLERTDVAATLFSICTDQSGLVGLLRHLHARGLVLLSMYRE